jgi:hypothetical protein
MEKICGRLRSGAMPDVLPPLAASGSRDTASPDAVNEESTLTWDTQVMVPTGFLLWQRQMEQRLNPVLAVMIVTWVDLLRLSRHFPVCRQAGFANQPSRYCNAADHATWRATGTEGKTVPARRSKRRRDTTGGLGY